MPIDILVELPVFGSLKLMFIFLSSIRIASWTLGWSRVGHA